MRSHLSDNMFNELTTNMSQPSKGKLKRQRRSFTQVLSRKLSYRERRSTADIPVDILDDPSELSIQLSAPGILKIFGNDICNGANYKSVLATPRSSAQELVKEALERYSVSKTSAREYLLCDVIGRFEGLDKRWRTECLRPLGDNEKPLLLQDLWKPKEGFARRFELRRQSEVEEMASKEKDTTTADINAQARKLQRHRAKGKDLTMSDYRHKLPPLRQSVSETSIAAIGNQEEEQQRLYFTLPGQSGKKKNSQCKSGKLYSRSSKEKQETSLHDGYSNAGYQAPHLLLLQGYNQQSDCLVYPLEREKQIVGQETALTKPNICLSSPDILSLHCKIKRFKQSKKQSCHLEEKTIVESFPNAFTIVNCVPVDGPAELRHGDLIGFGQHYIFLFKDPLAAKQLPAQTFSMLRHLQCFAGHRSSRRIPVCKTCGSIVKNCSANVQRNAISAANIDTTVQKRKLHLEYERAFEDVLIDKILTLIEPGGDDHKLTPACLLCLCIQHSAATFQSGDFMRLLLKIVHRMQGIAWGKTKELAEKHSQQQDTFSQPLVRITDLVPDLQHIFFWMSNSIELLYFIQQKVPGYIQGFEDLKAQGSKESLLSSTISLNEEVMTILEELIMHSFQQCVYYITKSLYVALPAFLDCNPFQTERGHSWMNVSPVPEAVRNIMQIYKTTLDLLHQYEIHPEITTQMFAYLFFFSNASLFNLLMDRGSRHRFFHWSKGEQMQGSLRLLLDWIQNEGIGNIADEFFFKFSSAIKLLAIPASILMQCSLSSLQREFHALTPSQLLHILTHHQVAPGVDPVAALQPSAEEGETLHKTEDILLSFHRYPPLVLPTSNFKVDLDAETVEDNLYRHLLYIRHFLWSLRTKFQSNNGCSISKELQAESPVYYNCHEISSDNLATFSNLKILDQQSGQNNHLSNNLDAEIDGTRLSTAWVGGSNGDFSTCHKQHNLHPRTAQGRHRGPGQNVQPSNPSCLLTPPNTPLNVDHVQTNGDSRLASNSQRNGHHRSRANEGEGRVTATYDLPTPTSSSLSSGDDDLCCVYVVELPRGPVGLGMGLIDGLHTTLKSPGIYIRTLLPDSPAASDGRLGIGDRILAVNGTSLIGADYDSAVSLIRSAGERPRFLIAKSDFLIAEKISASSC
ncbi:ras-associating and dilute domain-containing protein isoform X2 [Amblyraja radiata]|uniref:ras-associating and dilute domain-containing protein isoform X2 n=1 Tax=Amblyraja radiata TaxID=386614 RepID=UPI001403397C|nr:ras-associating and dilute domain-containing protein isoform X2 [Amblyraja radiata]